MPGHTTTTFGVVCAISSMNLDQREDIRSSANLPLVLGGVGLRSASRISASACWASWADCLPMVFARHRGVALAIVAQLEGHPDTPFLGAAAACARSLVGTMGFDPSSWQALCEGVRPRALEPDEMEPGIAERHFRQEVLFERMGSRDRAILRSHDDEDSASPPPPIAVLSVHVPVWPSNQFVWPMHQNRGIGSARFCTRKRCRSSVPRSRCPCDHQCSGPGSRFASPSRRQSQIGSGCGWVAHFRWVPVGFGHDSGVYLALRWFAAHRSSQHRRSGAPTSEEAQGTPELVGRGSRARLIVLAIEVGGRWSPELQSFVQLAKSKAREQPFLLQKRFEQAWRMRWGAFLACAAAKAVATCLLELRCAHGADGHTPQAWEVEADHRHMGLAP